jgi:hypothetical protein
LTVVFVSKQAHLVTGGDLTMFFKANVVFVIQNFLSLAIDFGKLW